MPAAPSTSASCRDQADVVIELDKAEQDARMALDEMKAICGDRKPIDE